VSDAKSSEANGERRLRTEPPTSERRVKAEFAQKHRLSSHYLKPEVVVVEANDYHLVAVGQGWFSSAFGVAFGDTISEVCQRFSDELRALLDATEGPNAVSDDECLALVRSFQRRISVAAEWAERIEQIQDCGQVC
jgi:hypothetical protein